MKLNLGYAIREIIIVIIGISLAFGLNKWNEGRNNRSQKQQYFNNLISDTRQEIEHLEENQKKITKKINTIQSIRPFLGRNEGNRDSIVRKVFELARLVNFNPENTTYQTLINSGDMSLIDDFELRRNIEEHYSIHETVRKNYERIEQIHQKYLGDFFIYDIDYKNLSSGNYNFLDNPLISNILTSIEGAYYLILEGNDSCILSNKQLYERIKQEL